MKNESGQTVVEYILLVVIVVSAAVFAMQWVRQRKIDEKLMIPLNDHYARTYQYGHPQARGYDDGSPNANHPRAVVGGKVRLFINPQ